ncbi:unnamed protein product, partial [Vitis vinifera]|uniref:Uncharacterized protein n=1 Tax=Vitis vinifera TaxID=29760 RepID=D7T6X6_VITVI
MQRDNKNPNQTRNQLHSYLREPFSGKALFCYKHLKFPFKINKTNETAAPLLLSKHTALPPCSLASNLPLLPPAARLLSQNLPLKYLQPQLKLQDSRISHSCPWDPPPPLKSLSFSSTQTAMEAPSLSSMKKTLNLSENISNGSSQDHPPTTMENSCPLAYSPLSVVPLSFSNPFSFPACPFHLLQKIPHQNILLPPLFKISAAPL